MVGPRPAHSVPLKREQVGLDTNVFIYFLEDHPRHGAWCASLFERIEQGRVSAVTSTVTLLELLVQPYQQQKDDLTQKIFALFSTYPRLEWIPVTLDVADRAAALRAHYRLSTPDAVQVAAALSAGATRFYGNDRVLQRVKEIECVILDDLGKE